MNIVSAGVGSIKKLVVNVNVSIYRIAKTNLYIYFRP